MPRISVVVPVYQMENWKKLTRRNLDSILSQSFKDYEIVISDDSDDDKIKEWLGDYFPEIRYFRNTSGKGMANNTNFALDQAEGDVLKILYQDDYFYDNDSLGDVARYFTPNVNWLVTGCTHTYQDKTFNDHIPFFSQSENTIGSPSVLAISRDVKERFDPQFDWVLDLDLYKRLFKIYGLPKILEKVNVVIGLHEGQMTHLLSEKQKIEELEALKSKYE